MRCARWRKRHRLTLNTVVQGAWALLLSRYSGQRDVVFGCGRVRPPAGAAGSEAMVGLFINTLAARVRVDEDASVAAWLEGLQRQLAEMREYEHSALVDVQGWSEVPRGRPLFESIVVFAELGQTSRRSSCPSPSSVEVGDNRWFDGCDRLPADRARRSRAASWCSRRTSTAAASSERRSSGCWATGGRCWRGSWRGRRRACRSCRC